MQPANSVLIVDDDAQIRILITRFYERAGWKVHEADSGRSGLRMLFEYRPDVVVLDLNMQELDGWATLTRIREISDVPVVMLTGSSSELDKVRALRGGADDYVTKPFSLQELLARTEAVIRRSAGRRTDRESFYDDGLVGVDFRRQVVRVAGEEVTLTPLEFRLIAAFVGHPGYVLSAPQLLGLAWESGVGTRDQVKVYVGYLRRKLGPAGDRIETVRGFGYRYRAQARDRDRQAV